MTEHKTICNTRSYAKGEHKGLFQLILHCFHGTIPQNSETSLAEFKLYNQQNGMYTFIYVFLREQIYERLCLFLNHIVHVLFVLFLHGNSLNKTYF